MGSLKNTLFKILLLAVHKSATAKHTFRDPKIEETNLDRMAEGIGCQLTMIDHILTRI